MLRYPPVIEIEKSFRKILSDPYMKVVLELMTIQRHNEMLHNMACEENMFDFNLDELI